MARKPFHEPTGDAWSINTLQRATEIGQRTFAKAAKRRVEWPRQNWQKLEQDDPVVYTSLEDAFDTVLQFMSQTTRQCKDLDYETVLPPRQPDSVRGIIEAILPYEEKKKLRDVTVTGSTLPAIQLSNTGTYFRDKMM